MGGRGRVPGGSGSTLLEAASQAREHDRGFSAESVQALVLVGVQIRPLGCEVEQVADLRRGPNREADEPEVLPRAESGTSFNEVAGYRKRRATQLRCEFEALVGREGPGCPCYLNDQSMGNLPGVE